MVGFKEKKRLFDIMMCYDGWEINNYFYLGLVNVYEMY